MRRIIQGYVLGCAPMDPMVILRRGIVLGCALMDTLRIMVLICVSGNVQNHCLGIIPLGGALRSVLSPSCSLAKISIELVLICALWEPMLIHIVLHVCQFAQDPSMIPMPMKQIGLVFMNAHFHFMPIR